MIVVALSEMSMALGGALRAEGARCGARPVRKPLPEGPGAWQLRTVGGRKIPVDMHKVQRMSVAGLELLGKEGCALVNVLHVAGR